MNRRDFLRTGLLAGAGVLAAPMLNLGRVRVFADDDVQYSVRAVELVNNSMVIDMLGLLTLDWPTLWRWQSEPALFGPADLQKLRASGVNVFHPAVDPNQGDAHAAALRWTAGWNHLLHGHPESLLRIDGAADLARTRAEGKIGILIGFQNADHFRTVADVGLFYGLGQRVSQLTYNDHNRLGAGCKETRDLGLTPYGAEIVLEMNRLGMAVDVSHCAEPTAIDAFAVSKKPVLITHSNCRALVPHPRCKSDAAIRAMAKRGGVMGITVVPAFVRAGQPATIDHVLDHFDHVARLVGVEHVGLGSDADVDTIDPKTGKIRARYEVRGLEPLRRVFELTEKLVRRGYSDAQIELMLGGNFQRALTEIWRTDPALPARG